MTKGKWIIDKDKEQLWIECPSRHTSVALMYGDQEDANLIASAPELYEALKNALVILRSTKPTQNAINVVIIDAISALNKAEGKPDATK